MRRDWWYLQYLCMDCFNKNKRRKIDGWVVLCENHMNIYLEKKGSLKDNRGSWKNTQIVK